MTVWALEDGDYSDYHVIGVFSSEANAKLAAIQFGGSVVEWPLDPAVDEINAGLSTFIVWMHRDGYVERCETWQPSPYHPNGEMMLWRRSQAPAYRGTPKAIDIINATVWARDENHAVKIVNEHRSQLIASGEWA